MPWLEIALFKRVNSFVEVLINMVCEIKNTSWNKKKFCRNFMVIQHCVKRVISEKQCYTDMKMMKYIVVSNNSTCSAEKKKH